MKTVKLFALLALALAALIFATGGRGTELAERAYSWAFPKYRVERVAHTVKCGDTLYSIARVYAEQQDKWDDLRGVIYDIQKANDIEDNDVRWLVPGRRIVVPLSKQVRQ